MNIWSKKYAIVALFSIHMRFHMRDPYAVNRPNPRSKIVHSRTKSTFEPSYENLILNTIFIFLQSNFLSIYLSLPTFLGRL